MISYILGIIIIYLLYRFIFGFLIPVIGASRQMRMKMRQMQEQMNNQYNQQTQGKSSTNNTSAPENNAANTSTSTKGDYIEFEEVK